MSRPCRYVVCIRSQRIFRNVSNPSIRNLLSKFNGYSKSARILVAVNSIIYRFATANININIFIEIYIKFAYLSKF